MADEIDTRITPSFHPETIREVDEYDDETASILAGTEAAFDAAYSGVGRVHEARDAAKTNRTWNEAQQIIETANFSDKIFASVAKQFDGASANLTRIVEGLERDLSQPIESRGVGAMSGEPLISVLPTFENRTHRNCFQSLINAVHSAIHFLTSLIRRQLTPYPVHHRAERLLHGCTLSDTSA